MKKALVLLVMFAFTATFISFANADDAKKDGKTIFTEAKCINCHGVSAQQIEPTNKKSKAPDLSTIGDKQTKEVLLKYLAKEAQINDKNHPIKYNAPEAGLLVDWMLTLKTPAK